MITEDQTEFIRYDPEKQGHLMEPATSICDKILRLNGGKMPRVPWFSQDGQEAVFYKVSEMVIVEVLQDRRLSQCENARSGVFFLVASIDCSQPSKI